MCLTILTGSVFAGCGVPSRASPIQESHVSCSRTNLCDLPSLDQLKTASIDNQDLVNFAGSHFMRTRTAASTQCDR